MTRRGGLLLLVGAALALRMSYCALTVGLGQAPVDNYREYILAGQRLLERGDLVSPLITVPDAPLEPSHLLPPAYAGLVALLYGLFGVESFAATLALQLVNALATALAVLPAFALARRFGGALAGWLAAGLVAMHPVLIGYTVFIWDTALFTLAVTLSAYWALRLGDRPRGARPWAAFGLWLGAVALLNPALTIAYPLLVLWPLTRLYGWRWRKLAPPVAVTLVAFALPLVPWTVRNYVLFDRLMYVRGGFMLELWLGVCPEAGERGALVYPVRFPLKSPAEQQRVAALGEQAYIDACGRAAREAIAADPGRFLGLIALRAIDYWAGTVLTHALPGDGVWPQTPARRAVAFLLSAEVLLLVAALLVLRRVPRDLAWMLAVVVLFSLIYVITHTEIRFRAPTEPLLMAVLAAAALQAARAVSARRAAATPASTAAEQPASS